MNLQTPIQARLRRVRSLIETRNMEFLDGFERKDTIETIDDAALALATVEELEVLNRDLECQLEYAQEENEDLEKDLEDICAQRDQLAEKVVAIERKKTRLKSQIEALKKITKS